MGVSVVGLGRAGLPLACVIADSGQRVYGIDVDRIKCAQINAGQNPYPDEPCVGEIIDKHGGDMFYATPDYDVDCDVYIVIVPVGLTPENKPDFTFLESACRSVGSVLKPDDLVVIETTVPVGTTSTLVRGWLEDESHLVLGDFYLAHSPERIMAGLAVSRLKTFPKVVGGVDEASGLRAYRFYSEFLHDVRLATSSRVAEFTKIAEGVYRNTNIALANELYMSASAYCIDYGEAVRLANHEYCHLHQAGIGVGGHCVGTYPHFLISDDTIARPEFIEHACSLNQFMLEYWTARIMFEIDYDPDVRVCVSGISYRPGVKSIENSCPIALYLSLKESGVDVYANDPLFGKDFVEELGLRWIDIDDADAVFNPFTLELEHV